MARTWSRKFSRIACGSWRADQAEADLGMGLGGQHRLEPVAGIAAPDAVHLAGRARPDHLQRRAVLLARRHRQADVAEELRMVEGKRLPLRAHLVRQFGHAVVEARHGDAARRRRAGRAMTLASTRIGLIAAPPYMPECRSLLAAGDGDLLAQQAAQHGDDRRHGRFEQPGVADQRDVGLSARRRCPSGRGSARASPIPPRPRGRSSGCRAGRRSPPSRPGRPRRRSSAGPCRRWRRGRGSPCRWGRPASRGRTGRGPTATADRPAARRNGHRTADADPRRRTGAAGMGDDHRMAGGGRVPMPRSPGPSDPRPASRRRVSQSAL